ncbi:MEDS domain-containing protein [Candidatus Nitrososphaera evergladensis]|nr:MEDS domain-containing protein [Candidatus Nitrososphaera evergladensis]
MLRPIDLETSEHVMLLYDSDQVRDEVAAHYINEGIDEGQLVIYASVDAEDLAHLARLASRITEYQENISQGNLLIVSLKQCYQNALAGDLSPFGDIKKLVERASKERLDAGKGDGRAIIVADCADTLSKNEKFEECGIVENWWRNTCREWLKNNLQVTVICPHLHPMLDDSERELIGGYHSMTVKVP